MANNFNDFTSQNLNSGDLVIKVPFLKNQSSDTQFFIINKDEQLLIPERFYTKIVKITPSNKEYYVKITNTNHNEISVYTNIKFVFLNTNNSISINKTEYSFLSISQTGQEVTTEDGKLTAYTYDLPKQPGFYDKNFKSQFQIYFNRKLIFPEKNYELDFEQNKLIVYSNIEDINTPGIYFDILCFYSGSEINATVTNLPQSGYIYIDKHNIDRNYNNNLMTIFVNGKLIDTKDIIQINNNIFKIDRDLETRYDLNILNLSPKIDTFVPFYKNFNYSDYDYSNNNYQLSKNFNINRNSFDSKLFFREYNFDISLANKINDENNLDAQTELQFIQLASSNHYCVKLYKYPYSKNIQNILIAATLESYENIVIGAQQDFTPIILGTLSGIIISVNQNVYKFNILLKDLILKFFPQSFIQNPGQVEDLFNDKQRIITILNNIIIHLLPYPISNEDIEGLGENQIYYEVSEINTFTAIDLFKWNIYTPSSQNLYDEKILQLLPVSTSVSTN